MKVVACSSMGSGTILSRKKAVMIVQDCLRGTEALQRTFSGCSNIMHARPFV